MGIVLSCCQDNDSEENEALLAGQQNGFGDDSAEDYNARQLQTKLHEEQMRARDEALKEIVSNTNDKLIDISMISNSGIVIQGTDLKKGQGEMECISQERPRSDADELILEGVGTGAMKYTVLDAEKVLSAEMRQQLKALHNAIFESLDEQLQEEIPSDLVVSLSK
ncbi:hypothetical protein HG535_0D03800 [Zygotorulaspora mrakii]|uniref:Uncharacterized protein n=1 Tax=Zygotorulaspora mrakii TaxID=42260 RepID=A0A7H9B4I3_ZYGMR|nr:uncharacterized protein HG535_0D03800 [Zygotorulaspora mrakii]QLG72672.1 hypothetical protein HG535_0D03800 [Zygotorulaspora mrakii]